MEWILELIHIISSYLDVDDPKILSLVWKLLQRVGKYCQTRPIDASNIPKYYRQTLECLDRDKRGVFQPLVMKIKSKGLDVDV